MNIENKLKKYEKDICIILAKLAYHIDPKIIARIQNINIDDYRYFKDLFTDRINVDDYLFDGSACVFPGVRRFIRHNGTKIKYNAEYKAIIDDNTFPRHLWCHLINGRIYNNNNWIETRLDEFELAHIFSHKESETDKEQYYFESFNKNVKPFGLFTCATNVVLLPKGTVRPTDNSNVIKAIFYKRFIDLYKEDPLNGRKGFKSTLIPDWYQKLEWNDPFLPNNWEDNIAKLMKYRRKRIARILEN